MRILVVSDTHGDVYTLRKVVNSQPTAEIIIHCGDGDEQVQFLKENYKDKMIVGVKGNCDWYSFLPAKEILSVCGKKIFITHGHLYNAKLTLYQLVCAAREAQADILLFGHTHNAMTDYEDGLHIMNPGSCHGYGASYGFIDITDKGDIVTNTVIVK
ncbi:MAG: metallophosphoesterase [Ruminococcus sp.]|nr:metallophosphoesterase [Ruminococcus sp.]